MKYLGGSIWYLFTLSYLLQLIAKKENHNNTTACHNFCKEGTQSAPSSSQPPSGCYPWKKDFRFKVKASGLVYSRRKHNRNIRKAVS